MARKRVGSNEQALAALNEYFERIPESDFREGIKWLGDYIEERTHFLNKNFSLLALELFTLSLQRKKLRLILASLD